MSKLARSDEPKVNQVQMKSKAQNGKRIIFDFISKRKKIWHFVI